MDTRIECSALLRDAQSGIKGVRTYTESREQNSKFLIRFQGKIFWTVWQMSFIFRMKPCIELNPTLIPFGIVYVESGFANLENLETTVRIYSVNVAAKGFCSQYPC
jgi:hypothetical protein